MASSRRPFRFAVQARAWGDPEATAIVARNVEALGYDELYSFDHIGTVDPFVPLMVAAAATERLRVGPLVLNNELHHPVLLARTAATVDRLTGGRLVLGLGTGYAKSEHDAAGIELRAPGPRVSRFGECLQILRDLLDTGASHRSGEHHTVALDDLGIRPAAERVPFLVGGFGRRVIELAARHADIVQFTGLSDLPDGTMTVSGFGFDSVVERASWLSAAAEERDIERSALVQFVEVGHTVTPLTDVAKRFDVDEALIADSPFVLAGSVEQLVDQLERTRERTGISHYVVRDPDAFAPVVAALAGR